MAVSSPSEAVFVARSAYGNEIIPSTSMLFCIDETGDEALSDPKYPLFGLGGCAAPVRHYALEMALPWMGLKEKHFGSRGRRLHAVDYKKWSATQLNAIGEFFRTRRFARLAALVTRNTRIAPGITVYDAAATALLARIMEVLRLHSFSSVTFLFESSARGDRLAERFFSTVHFTYRSTDAIGPIKLRWYRTTKDVAGPLLEPADFVMHCAGSCVRDRLQGNDHRERRDFQAVFGPLEPAMAGYVELDEIGPPP